MSSDQAQNLIPDLLAGGLIKVLPNCGLSFYGENVNPNEESISVTEQ